MKYEVTARITVEAENPQHAVQLFDEEYRDSLTVVHLHAEEKIGWATPHPAQTAEGERRNNCTVAY